MHVLRLALEEVRKRLGVRLVAAAQVEAHGVLRRRRRDDDLHVASVACDAFEVVAQPHADAPTAIAVAHVQVRELRDPRADVRRHDPDPHESLPVECPERRPACVQVVLALFPLGGHRVLGFAVDEPRTRAPVAGPRLELGAVLHVERVDLLGPVDVADPREIGAFETNVAEAAHRLALGAHTRQDLRMRAMMLTAARAPLELAELPDPEPTEGKVLLRVRACGVCRTDLHILDGELDRPKLPLVLGHQIVGEVVAGGTRFAPGERVGVPWLGWTCGECRFCVSGQENLCDRARFTGYDLDGGYAQLAAADERYCLPVPSEYPDEQAAPLLCAGLIGYRALRLASEAESIGLYGFGASAHIICQVAVAQGRRVFAGTRAEDDAAQELARSLGAEWAGDALAGPPEELDAVIVFAPVGELVPAALRHVRKGGSVVCAGIHMSDIPSFPYELLWGERVLRSVANLTRADGEEFLALAPGVPVRTEVEAFALEQADEALDRLRRGELRGAAVLVP